MTSTGLNAISAYIFHSIVVELLQLLGLVPVAGYQWEVVGGMCCSMQEGE